MRIAPEGWIVLVPLILVALVAPAVVAIFWPWVGGPVAGVGLLLVLWGLWFFRDPVRTPPTGAGLIVSPADGRVIKVDRAAVPKELAGAWPLAPGEPVQRVAIFLNLFNVHVNRVPIAGVIKAKAYVPGSFVNASLDKASEQNERAGAIVITPEGRPLAFVQIAGLVARRIVCHLREGQSVGTGERFGLIRFGSRAEIYFPPGASVEVKVGDFVVAGESVIGKMG